jgi:hypothetical protein
VEADDVMLRKSRSQEDSGDDLSVLDKMIVWSRNKPLSKEEIAALGPQKKSAGVGLKVRPWATVKMIDTRGKRQRPVVFIGIQGTF